MWNYYNYLFRLIIINLNMFCIFTFFNRFSNISHSISSTRCSSSKQISVDRLRRHRLRFSSVSCHSHTDRCICHRSPKYVYLVRFFYCWHRFLQRIHHQAKWTFLGHACFRSDTAPCNVSHRLVSSLRILTIGLIHNHRCNDHCLAILSHLSHAFCHSNTLPCNVCRQSTTFLLNLIAYY